MATHATKLNDIGVLDHILSFEGHVSRVIVTYHVRCRHPAKEDALESVDPVREANTKDLPAGEGMESVPSAQNDGRYCTRVIQLGAIGTIGAIACVIALAYLVWQNVADWSSLPRSFDPRYLIVASFFHSIALLTAAYSWHRMVASVAGESSLQRNLRVYVTSAFARRLPGSLWGPALRMFWYRQLGGSWRTVGFVSILEVWALTISGAIIALVGAVFFIGRSASLRTWTGLAIVLLFLSTLFTPRVNRWLLLRLAGLLRTTRIRADSLDSRELLRWVILELVTWLSGGLMLAAILRAFAPYQAEQIPAILACWAAAGTVGMLITFVPGGFGIVELALTGLLGLFVPTSVALAAAIGLRVFVIACEILWMVIGIAAPAISRRVWPVTW